jgi:hypothetical protein
LFVRITNCGRGGFRHVTAAAFKPVLTTPARPADPDSWEGRYVLAFLWLRTLVGILGIALPLVVILIDRFAYSEEPFPRGSISVYYYSGVRDLFVAIMASTGIFFIAYKLTERTLENTLSIIAGASAILIPLFPTKPQPADLPPTALQKLLSVNEVFAVHFVFSLAFLLSLTGISFMFGWRERERTRRKGQKLSPRAWGIYHFTCAGLMLLALLWIAVTLSVHWPPKALLAGEWATAWAFGASWLAKGTELRAYRKQAAKPVEWSATAPAG